MKSSRLLASLAAVLSISVSTAAFAQAGPGNPPQGGNRRQFSQFNFNLAPTGEGLYNEVVKNVPSLTDDQKAKLKEKTDAFTKDLAAFNDESGKKMADMFNNANNNGGGRAGFAEEFRKINDDRTKLIAESTGKALDALTPEQKVEWETYKLARDITARLAVITPTDEQKAKVKDLVKDHAKTLAEMKEPRDAKAVAEVNGKAWRVVIEKLLTDEQVARLLSPGPNDLANVFGNLAGNLNRGNPGGGPGGNPGGRRGNPGNTPGGGPANPGGVQLP